MCKHHGIFGCMSIICINLCMSGIMMTCHVDVIFVQCVGNGCIHFSCHGKLDHLLYILESSFTTHGHTFFISSIQNISIHGFGKFLSVFSVKSFGKIYHIHVVYINSSILKFCIFHIMDRIDFQIFCSLYSRNGCFHTFGISYDQRSADFICFRFH